MKRLVILLTGVLTLIVVTSWSTTSARFGYQVGDYVDNFTLPNIDGAMVSLSDFNEEQGLIVVFTCNTCPYAKSYESRIMGLDKKYADKGFPVVAINPNDITKQPDDSMEKMQYRAKKKGYTFPYLRDDSQEVTKKFGATKTPHIYVLKKESSKYKVAYIGAIDNSPNDPSDASEKYVEDAINELIAGKMPTVKEKRAIGCSIKWKE